MNPLVFALVDGSKSNFRQLNFQESNKRLDSVTLVQPKIFKDSANAIKDSLSTVWIKAPDPNRPNRFLDSLISLYKVENLDFLSWASKFQKKSVRYDAGSPRTYRETWVIAVVLFLVLFFAVIRFFFPSELNTIVLAFYSNQALSKINKEDSLFNSWPFIFLYLLFSLNTGLYLYLSGKYLGISYPAKGFELFIYLSAVVVGLFTMKIIALRILGFLFDVQRLVREYVSVLYLSFERY